MSRSEHARDSEAMPTFVIEAKDRLALETMAYYSELCDRHGLAERSEQAHHAYRQMAEWRVGHRDQCEDPDRVQPPRPDLARVHWQLCGNCGTIFQQLAIRCPACRHTHTEARDEGPGLWSGTRTEMEQERASLLRTWPGYAQAWARTLAERGESPE
jgi:rubrerythrin